MILFSGSPISSVSINLAIPVSGTPHDHILEYNSHTGSHRLPTGHDMYAFDYENAKNTLCGLSSE
ncbi:MAG: hypothetical protein ACOCXT_05730 [Candidatus Dojkabacteria bacterium]